MILRDARCTDRQFRLGSVLPLVGLLALSLAGCSGGGATPDPTPSADSATDSATQVADPVEESAPASPEEAEPEEEPAPEPEPVATGSDCLVGSWEVSEAAMQGYYDSIDAPVEFEVSGSTGLSFTTDTYEYAPDFTLVMNVAGQDAAVSIIGAITGDYIADDTQITTMHDESDVQVSMTIGGDPVDAGSTFENFLDAFSINSAPFECTDESLILMMQNGDDPDVRTPMKLDRVG